MKSSSLFAAPALLVALSFLAGCSSSDEPPPAGTAGSPGVGGYSQAGAGGKAGSGGAAGAGVSGGGAGGGGGLSAGAGGLATAGSAGTSTAGSGGGAAIEASFATVKTVLNMYCFGNGCHGQEGNPLIMETEDSAKLYATLTTHVTANCGKLLDTANPAQSGFIKLLVADCGKTPRMPWDKCFQGDVDSEFCVSPAYIAAIQAWIAKGAPQQ